GELGYIPQAGAEFAVVANLNGPAFLDVVVGYSDEPCQAFFNRGFGTFGFSKPLELTEQMVPGAARGQLAAVAANFTGSGTDELAVATADGDLYLSCAKRTLEEARLIQVQVGKDVKSAGPVQVRLFRADHCLGTRRLNRWSGGGRFSLSEA